MNAPAHTSDTHTPEVGFLPSEDDAAPATAVLPGSGKTVSGKTTSLGSTTLYPYSLEGPVKHPLGGVARPA